MISDVLAAVGGVGTAAVPAGLALRLMRGRVEQLRVERDSARYDAMHDRLTGLLNRAGLDAAMTARVDGGRPWSMFLVDLDEFKQVNDTLGHDAGDEVLIEASHRLFMACDRPGDQVGRLGGDEFVVLTDDGPQQAPLTWLRGLNALMAVREPITLGSGSKVTVTASVGMVAVLPGAELRQVLRSVDIATYRAKALGGDRVIEYGLPGESATVLESRPDARLRDTAGIRWTVTR
jgi:diguanylate cyclase (GGDEF)-like protein